MLFRSMRRISGLVISLVFMVVGRLLWFIHATRSNPSVHCKPPHHTGNCELSGKTTDTNKATARVALFAIRMSWRGASLVDGTMEALFYQARPGDRGRRRPLIP